MKRKLGIITWHYFGNFGSALQVFALQEILKKMGHEVEVLNYRGDSFTKTDHLKNLVKIKLSESNVSKRYYPFLEFQKSFLNQTKNLYNGYDLFLVSRKKDAIICGSDQIWAPNVFNSIYMLDFIDGSIVKKISYAASIGLPEIPDLLKATYMKSLNDFFRISVRESSCQKMLRSLFRVQSSVVLDPTFMLSVEDYIKIEKKPQIDLPDKFSFCYFLNSNHSYKNFIKKTYKTLGIDFVGISRDENDNNWMEQLSHIGPLEFIWLIHNSERVYTDSYHGTIFSILFHKEFFTFERFKEFDPINQNTRIYQLDSYFNLGTRIIRNFNQSEPSMPLCFDSIEEKLIKLRNDSNEFLMEALASDNE